MRILLLADIHIGSIKDTSYVFKTITDIFDKELIDNNTDMVVFLGDVFEKLFTANSEYISLALEIFQYLSKISRKKNIKVRFIYGTESHEVSQYKIFKPFFEDKRTDFKLFTTVTEEDIDGIKILYIPEEYIDSQNDHYNDTLYNSDKQYDYIFGHGIIKEGMRMINHEEKERKEKFVPSFSLKELSGKCKQCIFGHYHVCFDDNNVHYLGSLFRNKFGEEEDKRYGIIEDDKFIPLINDKAYVYKTYTFDKDNKCYQDTEEFQKQITKIQLENKNIFDDKVGGKIRIIFDPPNDSEALNAFRENLKNILGSDKHFSYNLQSFSSDIELKNEKIVLEYDFILDKNLPLEEKVFRYLNKINPDNKLSLTEIIDIMYSDLNF